MICSVIAQREIGRNIYDFGLRAGPELSPIGRVDAIAGSTTNVSVIGPNPMIVPC